MQKTKIETLPLELRKLGLTEKEARVYLAVLKLGQTSVQAIAKKAQISRPTAYVIVKNLEDKELMTESKEKGKRYFVAQSPDHLLGILRRQKRELEEKEREFLRIIAALRAEYYSRDRCEIKNYSGKAGLELLLDDFSTSQTKEIYVLAADNKIWPAGQREKVYQRIKRRLGQIQVKEISKQPTESSLAYLERKSLAKNLTFKGIIIIYDKLIILPSSKNGLLVENKAIINLIKSLFLMVWQSGINYKNSSSDI